MKYAIVEDGGKQYKAVEGGSIDVDFYPAEIGEPVDLEHVLLIAEDGNVNVGKPYVTGALVQAKVSEQVKGPKLVVFRYKPKKRIRRKTGHRQKYTRLQIESIAINGSATDGSATDESATDKSATVKSAAGRSSAKASKEK